MSDMRPTADPAPAPGRALLTAVAWLWVLVPFGYGLWQLLIKVVQLFSG